MENSWFMLWRYLKAWPHSFALDPSSTIFWASPSADPIVTQNISQNELVILLYPHIFSEFPILVQGIFRDSLSFTQNTSINNKNPLLLRLYPDSTLLSDLLKMQVCLNNSPWGLLVAYRVKPHKLLSTPLVLYSLTCSPLAVSPPTPMFQLYFWSVLFGICSAFLAYLDLVHLPLQKAFPDQFSYIIWSLLLSPPLSPMYNSLVFITWFGNYFPTGLSELFEEAQLFSCLHPSTDAP